MKLHGALALLLLGTPAAHAAPPTFHADVEPILQRRCQTCHRPGDIAPMSLITYEDVRPWAKAIRSAVVQKKMPPWFADPAHDGSITSTVVDCQVPPDGNRTVTIPSETLQTSDARSMARMGEEVPDEGGDVRTLDWRAQ